MIGTLLEEITNLYKMIKPGVKRGTLVNQCIQVDAMMLEKLIELGYYTKDGALTPEAQSHFKDASDLPNMRDRLAAAKAQQENTKPWTHLDSWIENAQRTMHYFLEKYNIGYVDTVYVDDAGFVHAQIECITGDEFDGKWPEQLALLKELGIDLKEHRQTGRYAIPATGENVTALTKLFKSIHQDIDVNINIEYGEIETLTLEMKADSMVTLTAATPLPEEQPMEKEPKAPILSDEDYTALINAVQSVHFAAAQLDSTIDKMLLCKVMEMECALIGSIVDVDTELRYIVDERFKEEKKAASEYRALDKAAGDSFDVKNMSQIVTRTARDIHAYIQDNLGLVTRDIKFYPSSYGYVSATLKFPRAARINTTKWETRDGFALSTENNRAQILTFCKEHDINVLNMNLAYNTKMQDFTIGEITVQLVDLDKLLSSS